MRIAFAPQQVLAAYLFVPHVFLLCHVQHACRWWCDGGLVVPLPINLCWGVCTGITQIMLQLQYDRVQAGSVEHSHKGVLSSTQSPPFVLVAQAYMSWKRTLVESVCCWLFDPELMATAH